MSVHKRLTSKSGITIPKDLRAATGFRPGMAVDIDAAGSDTIIIRKHVPCCIFCGSPEDVIQVDGLCICARCGENIRRRMDAREGADEA